MRLGEAGETHMDETECEQRRRGREGVGDGVARHADHRQRVAENPHHGDQRNEP